MDIRLPLLHNASKLIMPNLWDLLAPLWWCDGPLERLGEPGDGGACTAPLTFAVLLHTQHTHTYQTHTWCQSRLGAAARFDHSWDAIPHLHARSTVVAWQWRPCRRLTARANQALRPVLLHCFAGKWMCDVNATLAEQPCVVLSMGSNAMTEWEEAVLARAPHCDVRLPSFLLLAVPYQSGISCAPCHVLHWQYAAGPVVSPLLACPLQCSLLAQVHTFDHTLSPDGQAKVANVSGVTFHPLGITRSVGCCFAICTSATCWRCCALPCTRLG